MKLGQFGFGLGFQAATLLSGQCFKVRRFCTEVGCLLGSVFALGLDFLQSGRGRGLVVRQGLQLSFQHLDVCFQTWQHFFVLVTLGTECLDDGGEVITLGLEALRLRTSFFDCL